MSGCIEFGRRRKACLCLTRQLLYDIDVYPGWKPYLSLLKSGVVSMIAAKRKGRASKLRSQMLLNKNAALTINCTNLIAPGNSDDGNIQFY